MKFSSSGKREGQVHDEVEDRREMIQIKFGGSASGEGESGRVHLGREWSLEGTGGLLLGVRLWESAVPMRVRLFLVAL